MSKWILKLKGKDENLAIEEIAEFIEHLKQDRDFEYKFEEEIK